METVQLPLFSSDYYRFTKEGALFVPKIANSPEAYDPTLGYNAVVIELDARLASDLDWKEALAKAADYPLIVWKLGLQLESATFSFSETLPFNSYRLALEHFAKQVWPEFRHKTLGAILYEGELDLTAHFIWNEELKELYGEFLQESSLDSDVALRRFCMRSLMEYLHQLIAVLPDELLLFSLFDATSIACPIECAHLLSKEFFAHIHPAVKGAALPQFGLCWESGAMRGGFIGEGAIPEVAPFVTEVGFVLPEKLGHAETLLSAISKLPDGFRLIDESVLAESWDELEEIAIVDELMSVLGKRKLKAFEAAGGKIRGRGI